jgi:carboxyl-terminal processing protease
VKSANIISDNYLLPVPKDFLYQSALARMRAALVDPEVADDYSVFERDDDDAPPVNAEKIQKLIKVIDDLFTLIRQKSDANESDYRAWLEGIFALNKEWRVASSSGLANAALQGMLSQVSGHFEQDDEADDVARRIEGIGADIYIDERLPHVSYVYPNSPADRAHLEDGDTIFKIDGKDTKGRALDDLVASLRGASGTKVVLSIRRGEEEELKDIEMVRAPNATWSHTVYYKFVSTDSKIGYLRFVSLEKDSVADADEVVKEMAGRGMSGLILDLRVGYSESVLVVAELVDRLVEGEWALVYDCRQGLKRESRRAKQGAAYPDVPLVVVVDRDTSGPKELAAAAVKGTGRGLVLGETTAGCAVGQREFRVSGHKHRLRFAAATYRTPKGDAYQNKGIDPDIKIGIKAEDRERLHARMEAENEAENERRAVEREEGVPDVQLQKAIEYLGGTAVEFGKKTEKKERKEDK